MTKQKKTEPLATPTKRNLVAAGIAINLSIGVVLGIALDNLALGLGIGLLFGVSYGVVLRAGGKQDAQPKK